MNNKLKIGLSALTLSIFVFAELLVLPSYAPPTTYFEEDFESGNLNNWSDYEDLTNPMETAVINDTIVHSGNYSMKAGNPLDTSGNLNQSMPINNMTLVNYEYYVWLSDDAYSWALDFADSNLTFINYIELTVIGGNWSLIISTDTTGDVFYSIVPAIPNVWHKVNIIVQNITSGVHAYLYIDDALTYSAVSLGFLSVNLNQLYLFSYDTMTVYFDDFKVSNDPYLINVTSTSTVTSTLTTTTTLSTTTTLTSTFNTTTTFSTTTTLTNTTTITAATIVGGGGEGGSIGLMVAIMMIIAIPLMMVLSRRR